MIFGGPAGVELLVIIPDEAEFEDEPDSPLYEKEAAALPEFGACPAPGAVGPSLCLRPSGGGCNLNLKGDR